MYRPDHGGPAPGQGNNPYILLLADQKHFVSAYGSLVGLVDRRDIQGNMISLATRSRSLGQFAIRQIHGAVIPKVVGQNTSVRLEEIFARHAMFQRFAYLPQLNRASTADFAAPTFVGSSHTSLGWEEKRSTGRPTAPRAGKMCLRMSSFSALSMLRSSPIVRLWRNCRDASSRVCLQTDRRTSGKLSI